MHISEGVLSIPVLLTSTTCAVIGITIGLRKLDAARIPMTAVLTSVFFVASLVHVPIGLGSVHLVLNGLCGLLLGWAVFPAILVALLLQAILFGFGGLTTLGINTLIMALPGLVCYYLLGQNLMQSSAKGAFWRGCTAGVLSIILGTCIIATALYLTGGRAFTPIIAVIWLAHLPVMVIEGIITGMIIGFLYRVEPDLLNVASFLHQTP